MIGQLLNQLSDVNVYLDSNGLPSLWSILIALLLLFTGRWIARRARLWFERAIARLDKNINDSILRLSEAIIYYGILLVALLLALAALGIPIDTLLLALGIVVIFLAVILQPTLSNMAATIIFIVFQTYKQGDWIEVGGTFGQVQELQMFNTVLLTVDKRTVVVPNGKILRDDITNYSVLGVRRVDLRFIVAYQDDVQLAKQLLIEIVAANETILTKPETVIGIEELGDKGVEFVVRPYVQITDYMPVKLAVTEQVKLRFDEAGLTIPIPQHDVHLLNRQT